MIRLNLSSDPRWIELLPGLRLKVIPVTTSVMVGLHDQMVDLDPDAPVEVEAIRIAKDVARAVVIDWEGVGDEEGNPAPVSPEAIDALLDLWPVFEAFQREVVGPQLVLESEKNGSAPSLNGTTAGATGTAKPARRAAKPAQRA